MRHTSSDSELRGVTRWLALFCLVLSWSAQATAPRVAPQMFGEEQKTDIVGYLTASSNDTKLENKLVVEIVMEAFKASGMKPVIDMLPSRQLAKYALQNKDTTALIGRVEDLMDYEESMYRVVAFYLGDSGKPLVVIFSKEQGYELHLAFSRGLRKILQSGRYVEILEKYRGKGQVPADYVSRIQRLNPGWK